MLYFYQRIMKRHKKHSWILFALVVLFAHSCKHKEQEAKAVKKTASAKKKQPHTATKKTHSSNKNAEWFQVLGMTRSQVRSNELYAFVDDWYGTPYKYSGCSKSGVDCSCFTNICYEKVYGKKLSRTAYDLFLSSDHITIGRGKKGDLGFIFLGWQLFFALLFFRDLCVPLFFSCFFCLFSFCFNVCNIIFVKRIVYSFLIFI